jgi:hypothetical protein
MGLAFIWFYLLGNNAFWGLLFGGILGYGLQGLSWEPLCLYLMADIVGGYWGAKLCQNSFSSDIRLFKDLKEWWNFFIKQAACICVFSAACRCLAMFVNQYHQNPEISVSTNTWIWYYIDLWLADLNAVMILSAFLFPWITLPFSRGKMRAELYLTAVLFVGSVLYLAYFGAYKESLIHKMGIEYYTLIPSVLLGAIWLCIVLCYTLDHARTLLINDARQD